MADHISSCQLTSHQNICCCGPIFGICVVQPLYQTLHDGKVVNNPAYVTNLGKSFWTYKFIIDCDKTTRAINKLGIPICSIIKPEQLIVYEKIDSCGDFTSVPFTLTPCNSASSFQWVNVVTMGRYDKGASVEYRLEILGDYPSSTQPIIVKTHSTVIPFDCGCFLVPSCPKQGKLQITKSCDSIIKNNKPILNYFVHINNFGKAPLTNVQYQDHVVLPVEFPLGQIIVTPHTLHVNTSTPGIVSISGNLGTINSGGSTLIKYTIPIVSISDPGTFIITNTAIASAKDTYSSSTCSSNLEVVGLNASNCCSVTKNNIAFRITLTSRDGSPDTRVDIIDQLFIPAGLTVIFNNFGGCISSTDGIGNPVPPNTNITGPITVTLRWDGIRILQEGSAHKKISLTLISCTNFSTETIRNTLQKVSLSDPLHQLFLGSVPYPLEADISINLSVQCP